MRGCAIFTLKKYRRYICFYVCLQTHIIHAILENETFWVVTKHCAVQQVAEIKKFHYFYGQKDDVHAFNVLP